MHGPGQAMGTAAGGMAWEWVGFEDGMLVESLIIFGSILSLSLLSETVLLVILQQLTMRK